MIKKRIAIEIILIRFFLLLKISDFPLSLSSSGYSIRIPVGITTVTVETVTEEEEVVEVEAIVEEKKVEKKVKAEPTVEVLAVTEELPYTGFNWLFSLAGLLMMATGGTILGLRFKPKKGMK